MLQHIHKTVHKGHLKLVMDPTLVMPGQQRLSVTTNSSDITIQEVSDFFKTTYDRVLTNLISRDQVLYVCCSGLGSSHQAQMNDDYLEELRTRFPNLIFMQTKPKLFNISLNESTREIDAIFDLIMAERYATTFIGAQMSSFSHTSCYYRLPAVVDIKMISFGSYQV